jgi:hypothetical protein
MVPEGEVHNTLSTQYVILAPKFIVTYVSRIVILSATHAKMNKFSRK